VRASQVDRNIDAAIIHSSDIGLSLKLQSWQKRKTRPKVTVRRVAVGSLTAVLFQPALMREVVGHDPHSCDGDWEKVGDDWRPKA
jgi:hypothetical protein